MDLTSKNVKARRQILLLIITEFEQINEILFPRESSWFFMILGEIRSQLIWSNRLLLEAKFGEDS